VGDHFAQLSLSPVLNDCPADPSHAELQDANPRPASPPNNWNCCNRYHVDAFPTHFSRCNIEETARENLGAPSQTAAFLVQIDQMVQQTHDSLAQALSKDGMARLEALIKAEMSSTGNHPGGAMRTTLRSLLFLGLVMCFAQSGFAQGCRTIFFPSTGRTDTILTLRGRPKTGDTRRLENLDRGRMAGGRGDPLVTRNQRSL